MNSIDQLRQMPHDSRYDGRSAEEARFDMYVKYKEKLASKHDKEY